jgi:hypothetical protein
MIDANRSHSRCGQFPWATSRAYAAAVRALSRSGSAVPRRSPKRARSFGFFAGFTLTTLLVVSATTSTPSVAQEDTEGITGYVACLDAAVRSIDDGRSSVAAVAAAAKGACTARFPELAKAPGKASAAAQRKYEQRVQARQMELSVMVVQDLRGQP